MRSSLRMSNRNIPSYKNISHKHRRQHTLAKTNNRNAPAIIDETANVEVAVSSIRHSKTFDNGRICASENSVIALDSNYDAVKKEFIYRGAHFLNAAELEKVRKTIIIHGAANAKVVGQTPYTIAKRAGFEVDPKTKLLIGEVSDTSLNEEFAHEK